MIKAEWTSADTLDLQPTCNQLATDCISRQAAIDALGERPMVWAESDYELGARNQYDADVLALETVPPAQPTLYGYSIESLAFIAALLAKENLPPERVSEALSDIGRIIALVRKESEEAMRKAVPEWMI